MIQILHRYTRAVLYASETAQTIAEAVMEAARKDLAALGIVAPSETSTGTSDAPSTP